jgi:hypothetical protein
VKWNINCCRQPVRRPPLLPDTGVKSIGFGGANRSAAGFVLVEYGVPGGSVFSDCRPSGRVHRFLDFIAADNLVAPVCFGDKHGGVGFPEQVVE